jgi:hypothetical protein
LQTSDIDERLPGCLKYQWRGGRFRITPAAWFRDEVFGGDPLLIAKRAVFEVRSG